MSRSGKAAKGFATGVIQFLVQILVQILLAPLVLKVAGRETLGAYAAITQVIALLGLVDVAGSWSLERFLAQAMGKDSTGKRFREVFTTARMLFLITNMAFGLLVVLLGVFIGDILHLSAAVEQQARWALWVIAAWSVIRTPLAAYANASIAMQDMAAVYLIGTLVNTLRAVAQLSFVLAGGGLFGLMLAGTVAEASGYFLYRVRFRKKFPNLMPGWGIPDPPLLREMLRFGGHSMFLNVGNVLIGRSGSFVAGLTNGAVLASSFYTSQLPAMTVRGLIRRLVDSATPAVNELYGRGDMERVKSSLLRVTRFVLALSLPLAVGVLLFNRDVVLVWVGLRQYAGTLLTVTLAVFCATYTIEQVAIIYSFTFGWVKLLSATTFLQGIAYFGLSLWLGRWVGLGGITLALAVAIVPQNFILWVKLGRELSFSASGFLGKCLLRSLVPLGCAAGLAWPVHEHIAIRRHHPLGVLEECLVFLVVYCVLAWFLMMDEIDRNDLKRSQQAAVNLGRSVQARFRRTPKTA